MAFESISTEEYAKRVREDWKEEVFLSHVINLARSHGWMIHHDRPARTNQGWRTAIIGDKGFPDLVLARDQTIIFAELKTEKGRVSPEQKAWLQALGGDHPADAFITNRHVYLWRPRDWETIVHLLQ